MNACGFRAHIACRPVVSRLKGGGGGQRLRLNAKLKTAVAEDPNSSATALETGFPIAPS